MFRKVFDTMVVLMIFGPTIICSIIQPEFLTELMHNKESVKIVEMETTEEEIKLESPNQVVNEKTITKSSGTELPIDWLEQIFSDYIDSTLPKSYKTGSSREVYIKKIAKAAAEIEYNDTGMGCWTLAMAAKESNFRMVKSHGSSACGLSQVIYGYHKDKLSKHGISKTDLMSDPYKSLKAGYIVLKSYQGTCNNMKRAIFAYRGYGSKGITTKVCERYYGSCRNEYLKLSNQVKL